MSIRLEVGRTYQVRDVDYVRQLGYQTEEIIVKDTDKGRFPLISNYGNCFRRNGSYGGEDRRFDLVREVKQSKL